VPNQRGNADVRDYSITAILSNNPLSVSLQTLSAENTCEHWRPAETLSRWDATRETVWRLLEASRSLSRPITRANQSIGSPYESNCINGYRQGSHSVINQRDSSNVLGHQASLELHDHDHDHDRQSITIRILIRAQYDCVSRSGINQDSYQHQSPIRFRITITIRYDSVSRSRLDHDHDQHHNPITIRIRIEKRSRFVSGSKVKNRLRRG